MSESEDKTQPETIVVDDTPAVQAAERVIAARYGGTPHLTVTDILREQYRNRVLRCAVEGTSTDAPTSVILKSVEGEGEQAYDPANDSPDGTAWRFYNEWAGNRFLDSLHMTPPLSAGFIGGDRLRGLIVLEDLGKEGKSLADWMLDTDRLALTAALQSYAASLGRLHAETIGKEVAFRQIRQEIGGRESLRESEGRKRLQGTLPSFQELCASIAEPLPTGFDTEIAQIQRMLDEPGPFYAFSPGDTCPDNHRLTTTPYARFFDFEFAGFAHTMLTAAYFYLPFPTCWCVNRLPSEIIAQMESVYRSEFSVRCPEAVDDSLYYPALLAARAFWTILTISWGGQAILGEDGQWGISSLRQRHLLRLENFVEGAESTGLYPALSDLARRLTTNLRQRWNMPEEMPLYPAFRALDTGDGQLQTGHIG